jgi:hypothetical protein
MGAIGTE